MEGAFDITHYGHMNAFRQVLNKRTKQSRACNISFKCAQCNVCMDVIRELHLAII